MLLEEEVEEASGEGLRRLVVGPPLYHQDLVEEEEEEDWARGVCGRLHQPETFELWIGPS